MDTRIDWTDLKIMAELQRDGRLTNVELARRVNLSPTPCIERVRRLERDGFIKGYAAELDAARLDAGLRVFVEVSIDRTTKEAFEQFAAKVKKLPEVTECYMVAGGFDYLLQARVRDMAAYRDFLGRALLEVASIRETRSYLVMEEVKSERAIPLPAKARERG